MVIGNAAQKRKPSMASSAPKKAVASLPRWRCVSTSLTAAAGYRKVTCLHRAIRRALPTTDATAVRMQPPSMVFSASSHPRSCPFP